VPLRRRFSRAAAVDFCLEDRYLTVARRDGVTSESIAREFRPLEESSRDSFEAG